MIHQKNTSSAVKPGDPFEVKIYEPKDSNSDYIKSADDMNEAKKKGEASGKVILDFVNKLNEGKEDKDKWKVTLTDGDISRFTVTPPKSAKAGDFVAIPIEYTYTNGSKDTHWFHFVVQESDNNRPEYFTKIGFNGDTLTSTPTIPEDTKKNKPLSYELVPGTYKDSAGNVWDNIKVDPTTGVVTAVIPEHADIKGGENLYVDVKVNYKDEFGIEKEETVKAQFIARPKYQTEVTKEYETKIPYKTNVVYDDTLEAGKVVETPGTEGKQKLTFKQVVINGEKGIIDENGVFQKDKEAVTTETITPAVDGEVRIGTKPAETTVEIPRGLDYELDYTRKDGDPEVVDEGNDGLVTVTTSRDPNTGEIKVTKTVTTEAKNKKIKIPAMTEGTVVDTDEIPFDYTVEFDPNFYTNYPDATDNYKIVKDGVVGTNKKTWTIVNSKIVGDYVLEKTDPVNAVIKVGQKDYTGTVNNAVTKEVPFTVKVVENPNLEAGKTNVKQEGKAGSRTYEYSGEIVNGKLKDGTNFTEKELTDKYVKPTEHIIEIGTKPVENEKSVESTVGVDVEWVFDPNKDIGVIEVGDLIPGKVTTKTVNKYNPKTGEIETTQETVVEKGKRKVVAGTKAYNGEFKEENKDIIPYETEIVFDNTLKAGEKVIDKAGENGLKTTTTMHKIVNGQVVESGDPVTVVNKEAVKQIIRVGSKTEGDHSYTEELPFKTEVEVNPELKKGEWRYKTVDGVEQRGKLGSRKTEWTIVNSKVQDEKKVTEEKPVNAIIEVGSADFEGEVKHTEHFEIPFEVEVRYNDQLPAGTSKEIQKGVAGAYDVEYRQDIKNGEVVGEMAKTESSKVEAKPHIIEIGTKPVEGNTYNIDENVNVEIEYVYDENLEKGKVETGELMPGKVTSELVNKIVDGKVVTEEVKKVTSAKQIVKVGSKDFTGTYEYKKTCPIPFEVEVREDPTLSKGEKKIEQQGVAGSKTTSYEQAIKNGQPDGDAKKTGEEVTKEPVKHIVLVGTKPLEGKRETPVEKAIPYETKVIYDETIDAGTRVVVSEGKDGKEIVTTTITTKDGDITVDSVGKVIEEKEDRVVKVGTKPIVKTENLPFDTEYEHDPNLEAGTKEKISDGTPGTVTITTTFNKETGKLETSVTRTEGTNAKYKYGSKTEGEVKVTSDIPFEVVFEPDDTMVAGETKVTQEGKLGKKETTITIKNSKEESREEKTLEEPVKKIVKIGTLCKLPTQNPGDNDNTSNPTNTSNPGGNETGTPGTTHDKPVTPGKTPKKPGDPEKPIEPNKPAEPGKVTEEKITDGKTPEVKTPEGKNLEDKRFEEEKKISDSEKSEEVKKTEEAEKSQDKVNAPSQAKVQEDKVMSKAVSKAQVKNDAKAPKTADAGLVAETASAGLASGLLLLLGRFKKREKEEENKKINK